MSKVLFDMDKSFSRAVSLHMKHKLGFLYKNQIRTKSSNP